MRYALAILAMLLVLPLCWSLYVTDVAGLDRSLTSSQQIVSFLDSRPHVVPFVAGWILCRLAHAGFPGIGWRLDVLVYGGVLIGHVLWGKL